MSTIKRFIYGMLYRYHENMCDQYNAWIEDASLVGNHKEVEYCCAQFDRHQAKADAYYSKVMEIRDRKFKKDEA